MFEPSPKMMCQNVAVLNRMIRYGSQKKHVVTNLVFFALILTLNLFLIRLFTMLKIGTQEVLKYKKNLEEKKDHEKNTTYLITIFFSHHLRCDDIFYI